MTVADSTTERIIQATLAWLALASARTPLRTADSVAGANDTQIIIANEPGPRPSAAYLTVKVLSPDIPSGTDHRLDLLADTVTVGTAAAGTTYTITVDGTAYAHVRLVADTNTTVAAALVVLINASDDLYAESSGAVITIGGTTASPTTTVGANLTLVVGAVPAVVMVGHRTTTLSVQGYGRETLAWLERAFQRIEAPDVRALNDAAGLTFRAGGGLNDLSSLLDTAFEGRYGRDLIATYKRHEDPSFPTAAESTRVTTYLDGGPSELVTVTTADMT